MTKKTNKKVFLPWSSRFCSADDEALRKSLVVSGGDGCKHQSGERPVREPEHLHSDWSRRHFREWALLEPADLIHLHQPHLQVRCSTDPHHWCPIHSHSFRYKLVALNAVPHERKSSVSLDLAFENTMYQKSSQISNFGLRKQWGDCFNSSRVCWCHSVFSVWRLYEARHQRETEHLTSQTLFQHLLLL